MKFERFKSNQSQKFIFGGSKRFSSLSLHLALTLMLGIRFLVYLSDLDTLRI